ncbi:MAG: glycosyltransferase family 2 protein [Deltaproteobacteria bacterium]|nr:glycosyltransferase family 2 protein [Deltaproteobacteria bacterium]
MKKSLAVVLLTRNEAQRIETCLESVAGWANEIIIVDGNSTDTTRDICQKYTHKIFVRPFGGSFSEDRNFGAAQATSEWILQLDADEMVPHSFKQKFETIRNNPTHAAYKTRRKNFFLGHCMNQGPWYHYIQVLYLKDKARFYGDVHERLECGGSLGILEAEIEHHPFQSIEQWVTRQNRYTTLAAKEIFETKGVLPRKMIRRQLLYKPFKMSWKLYVTKKGYRDGFHGLLFSLLYGFEHFLKWVKYWELTQPGSNHD